MRRKKNESIINLKLYRALTLLILMFTIVNIYIKFTTREINYYVYNNTDQKSFGQIWEEASKLDMEYAFEYVSIPKDIQISKMEFRIDDQDMDNELRHVYIYSNYKYNDWCTYYHVSLPKMEGKKFINTDITLQYDVLGNALVVKNCRLLKFIQLNGEKVYTHTYKFRMRIGFIISVTVAFLSCFFENVRDFILARKLYKDIQKFEKNAS